MSLTSLPFWQMLTTIMIMVMTIMKTSTTTVQDAANPTPLVSCRIYQHAVGPRSAAMVSPSVCPFSDTFS